jgi:hypothetical protein
MCPSVIEKFQIVSKGDVNMVRGKYLGVLLVSGLAMAGVLLSGCVSDHFNPVKVGSFFIECIHSSAVYISDVTIDQDADGCEIAGKVYRRNPSISGLGHIDVAVVSPAGDVLEKVSVSYFPKILPKTPGARKHRGSRFEVRLASVFPQWCTVRVAYHGGSQSDKKVFDCGDNAAAPVVIDYGG